MNTELIIKLLIVLSGAYLLGSIPFGALMGRLYGIDLLKKGSGSTGTTNVIRNIGLWQGLLVLVADILKGAAAAYLALQILGLPGYVVLSGIMAMIGHSHSIFIGFKGGKAAATGTGMILVISWQTFVIVFGIIVLVLVLTKYQSLASLIASGTVPFLLYYFKVDIVYVTLGVFAVAFVWYKHIPNIKRLLNGTENKLGSKKKRK
ncbi:glycerol-3-phosphate 1-O-acyltransferase PlsY [Candidatus Margulisiibacteriota bacterium]